MKNKQIIFTEPGEYKVIEQPIRELESDEVLLEVKYCGLCTWERHIFQGLEDVQFPFSGGHEISAEVVKAGESVADRFKPGDKATVAKFERCNSCYYCRKGLDNHCVENFKPISKDEVWGPGGFSEYVIAKDYEVYKIEQKVNPAYIALAEPIACLTRSQMRVNIEPTDTSIIIGAGIMGLLGLQLLKLRGQQVVVLELNKKRQQLAKEMGADAVLDPSKVDWVEEVKERTAGFGPENIFYTAGGVDVVNQCLEAVVENGNVVIYAPLHVDSGEINLDLIHYKEINLTGSIRHDQESFRKAARIISAEMIDFSKFNLKEAAFSDLMDTMKKAEENPDVHRYLMKWE